MTKTQQCMKTGANKFAICLFLLLFCGFYCPRQSFATTANRPQTAVDDEKKVTLNVTQRTLVYILSEIKKQTGLAYGFRDGGNESSDEKFSLNVENVPVDTALTRLFKNSRYTYDIVGKLILIHLKPETVKSITKSLIMISGRVVDEKGNPLPGVSVLIKGTTEGTATNADGEFELKVAKNTALLFSFIGMETQMVFVESDKPLNIKMKEVVNEMDEVVVTGYQAIKKKAMVGAYSQINAEDLTNTGTQTIESMLQGKIPGMMVINKSGLTGTRQKIRIRGTSTLVGNAEPVWVVDGIIQEDNLPFESEMLASMGNNIDMMRDYIGGAVSWLNPSDIEDITVLKDASATAIYGVKAANGVILITTKKGERGRMSINYSGSFSISSRLNYKKLELMNSRDRIALSAEAIERGARIHNETVGYTGLALAYMRREITLEDFHQKSNELEMMNTDWFDILYQTPFSHSHTLSFSGGTDNVTYRSSFGYTDVQNTAKGNSQKSFRANFNIGMNFSKKMIINASLSGAHSKTTAFASGVDPYDYALNTSRVIPCYNADGTLFYYDGTNSMAYNILNELDNSGNENELNNINVNLSVRYRITEDFTIATTFGGGISVSSASTWYTERSNYISGIRGYEFGEYSILDEKYENSQLPYGGMQSIDENRNLNYTGRIQAEYNKNINYLHLLNFVAGVEIRSSIYSGHSETNWGYMPDRGKTYADVPLTYNYGILNEKYARAVPSITDRTNNTLSYYLTGMYMFDERYAINFSVRGDGSNRLGEQQRFLPVWSAGLRWNVSEEPYMEEQRFVNNLALRLDFGYQGNVVENVSPDLITKMEKITLTGEYTMSLSQLPNPHLKWEKTLSINGGIDFALLDNKLNGSFNWYVKKTTNVVTQANVPLENGTESMYVNNGSMSNRGWDLAFNVTPIRTKDFMWTLGTSFSGNNNKINSTLPKNGKWEEVVTGRFNKEGYPVGSFWAFRFTGLDHDTGAPTFDWSRSSLSAAEEDATEYMVYMGTQEPTFTIGINTVLRWKRWSIPLNFYLSRGNYTFLASPYPEGYRMMSEFSNASTELNKRWRKPGDELHTNIPSIPVGKACQPLYPFQSTSNYVYPLDAWKYSDARVVNAWYIRFNDFTFSYQVPEKWLKGLVQSASINFSATNPIQIKSKDFKGRDPEVAMGAQPRSQNYSVNINISF